MKMKLYHCDHDTIDFGISYAWTLEIENRVFLLDFLSFLKNIESKEDKFCLLEKDKIVNPKECFVITDIIDFSFENRPLLNKLYNKLEADHCLDYQNKLDFFNIYAIIKGHLDNLINGYNFNMQYAPEISLKELLSLVKLTPQLNGEDFFEQILNFIAFNSEMHLYKLICFVGLKDYLTQAQIEELFKFCTHKAVNVLLLETKKSANKSPYEHKFYIDADLFDLIY